MSRILLAVLLVLAAATAQAQRPSTLSMSCQQAQSLVASRGAVVLSTGRYTYDRFVASRGYCAVGEYAYNGFAPTRDSAELHRSAMSARSAPPLWLDDDRDHSSAAALFGR